MRKFINENNLEFKIGSRNSTIVILIGYSQHLNWTKEQLEKELEKEIQEDLFLKEEINRLWSYCQAKNYKSYWVTEEAKKAYNL